MGGMAHALGIGEPTEGAKHTLLRSDASLLSSAVCAMGECYALLHCGSVLSRKPAVLVACFFMVFLRLLENIAIVI
jgi:hypothetical protein